MGSTGGQTCQVLGMTVLGRRTGTPRQQLRHGTGAHGLTTRGCHLSPRFLFNREGGYGGAPTMCRSVCHGGQSHYGRGPCGSGPEEDEAGTPDCQSGERYHPHPKSVRDGDGGSRARSPGIVPNLGSHQVEIEVNQVVVKAECVMVAPGQRERHG